ncbi:HPr family phosphocarrier protein [Oleiharenicola sp. Vm1]|uniref:HPr family phosphocarrier protein n=1 Tax=Oleiharenicola sp. Vm1 TaxID=3398393 RepID=UPI0039F464D7
MKKARVKVPWPEGLHLRRAVQLVKTAQRFRCVLQIRSEERIADLRSLLSVIALCAAMGATLDLEAAGDDEQEALQTVQQLFDA